MVGVGAVVLAGGGLLGGYQIEKQQAKPIVKYVEVVVTPTSEPTATPSATLVPAKTFLKAVGGQATAPATRLK